MNKLVPLLLFACLAGAQSAELAGVLDDYFEASEAGNADALVATLVIPEGDDGFTRAAVAALFSGFSQEDLEWSFVEEKFYGGDYAHVLFDLKGRLVEKSSGDSIEIEEPYVAIFERHGSKWLIWKLMPLNEFAYYASNYQGFISNASAQQVAALEEGDGGSNNGGGGGDFDGLEADLFSLVVGFVDSVDWNGLVDSFLAWADDSGGDEGGYAMEYHHDSYDGGEVDFGELDLVDSVIGFFVLIGMVYALVSVFKR